MTRFLPRRTHRASSCFRQARPRVEEMEPRTLLSASGLSDVVLAGSLTPNDPSFGQQYDMSKIQAPQAWGVTTGKSTVVVADIDSGIDYTHPDLYQNVWLN